MKRPTTYKVFVAGPSDVASEIELAREIISDISLLSKSIGVVFETFYWAEDATPGMAREPQARINEQAEGYDAFLAILGSKIGFPTEKYSSGTIEEIENAILNSSNSLFGLDSVMVFFKEVQVNIRDPNLKSLLQVQEFRESIGSRRVLFKDFSEDASLKHSILKSFGNLIKKHIENNYENKSQQNNLIPTHDAEIKIVHLQEEKDEEFEDEELGIMELDSMVADNMKIATEKSELVSKAISELGDKAEIHTKEIETATQLGDTNLAKRIFSEIASEMDTCAKILNENVESISSNFRESMIYMRQLLEIRSADIPEDGNNSANASIIEAINGILPVSLSNVTIFEKFQNSIQSMPRMTKDINSSKRKLIKETSKVISMFEHISKDCDEILAFYDEILNKL